MKKVKVSILMLNWNGIDFTRKCLRSLFKTTYQDLEILILDNASENKEAEQLKKEFQKYKQVNIYKSSVNLGYAAGMNKLYKYASGDFIMFINNDMEFSPTWLSVLVNTLENRPEIGAVQPKVKDLKAKNMFEYAAAGGGYIDILGYPFARGRIFSSVEKDNGQYDNETIVSWTGIFLTRKNILKKTGLFDPIFFNYAEDVDLCYRIYRAGYKILYVPTSIVYHFGGGVLGKNISKRMFFIHRNHIILLLKNWHIKRLLIILPPRIFMDFISFFYYFANGYKEISWVIIKAYISLLTLLPKIYTSRKALHKLALQKDTTMPIYKGSIVWDYFIANKRKFSTIFKNKNFPNI